MEAGALTGGPEHAAPPPPPPPPPVAWYQPLHGPARWATIALWVWVAFAVAAIVGDLVFLGEFSDHPDDLPWDDPALDGYNLAVAVIGGLQLLMFAAGAAAFIVWFHRAYKNVPSLWPEHRLRRGPGWAIGAWFVPIINLWWPYMMAREIWRAGDPHAGQALRDDELRINPLLITWWLLWVVTGIVANASGQLFVEAEDLATLRDAAIVDIVSYGVTILAALAAIAVVRAATRRMEDRAAQLYGAPRPALGF